MAHEGDYIDENGEIVLVNQEDEYNDLDAISDDLGEAGQMPDGGFASDIQRAVSFSRIHKERQGDDAAVVNAAPRSVVGNSDPLLGSWATVTAGGISIEVVRWSGNVDEARAVTLSIGYMNLSQAGAVTPASGTPSNRPYAIVNYGTRNYTQSITIDVSKGNNFSFSASWVAVSVGLDMPSGGNAGTMNIGASLGFGGSGGSCPVTRTVYFDSALTAGSLTSYTTIPTGAKQLLPIQRSFAFDGGPPVVLHPAAMIVYFYDINQNIIAELYGGDTVYSVMSNALPLPNDAYSFRVLNNDATYSIPAARFVFQLGF